MAAVVSLRSVDATAPPLASSASIQSSGTVGAANSSLAAVASLRPVAADGAAMGGVGEAAVSDGVGVFLLTAPSRATSSSSGRAEAEALTRHENASTREVRTNIEHGLRH